MAMVPPHRHLLDDERGGTTTTPLLTTSDHGGKAYTNQSSFDTNMVIILGALLCALICALGLNSIVRCALRCTGRLSNSTQPDPAGATRIGVGFRGLKRSTIRQIPVAIYGNDKSNTSSSFSGSDNTFISTDCIICLGEFVEGEKIRVLPKCKHGFHIRCIDTWLLSHSSCPTCRQSVSVSVSVSESVSGGGSQGQLASESG